MTTKIKRLSKFVELHLNFISEKQLLHLHGQEKQFEKFLFYFLSNILFCRFFGPYMAMLGKMTSNMLRFFCLFMGFYIPYACAFWMVFGMFLFILLNRQKIISTFAEFMKLKLDITSNI